LGSNSSAIELHPLNLHTIKDRSLSTKIFANQQGVEKVPELSVTKKSRHQNGL
jgi:hypothetical protein